MDLSRLHASCERFADLADADAIGRLCRDHGSELGFESFIYALRVPDSFADAHVIQVKGYPDDWLDRYWREQYFAIDPVIAHCTKKLLPIAWHELTPGSLPASRRMMNEAGEFGLRSGVSVPVHGPRGELGILSFASSHRARSEDLERAKPAVHLLAGYVHEAVRRAFDVDDDDVQVPLSTREQDCLRWAAEGKTSWEIGQLCTISERTVNFHLDNAVRKLGAQSRQHAIAKAILTGTLRPSPF